MPSCSTRTPNSPLTTPLRQFVKKADVAVENGAMAGGTSMRRHQKSIRPSGWPVPDQQRLANALSGARRRYARTRAQCWSEATVKTVLSSYCCGLGWLADNGLLDWSATPAQRWPLTVLEAYLAHLQTTYSKATVCFRIGGLERAISILEPEADRGLLLAALKRLGKPGPNPIHEAKLQSSADLLQLGHDLMDKAEADHTRKPFNRAIGYRTGLQIAFLALRFLRIRDFKQLALGEQLFEDRGSWRLRIRTSKTRGKVARHTPFPAALVQKLERYLHAYRPQLGQGRYGGKALWVSSRGKPQSQKSIYWNICKQTKMRFGKPVNPHLFRNCAATTMALHAPMHMHAISHALGHSGSTVRDKHYNLAGSFSASIELNGTVEAVLREARARRSWKDRARPVEADPDPAR
jgi:integrase/recombinase XerD